MRAGTTLAILVCLLLPRSVAGEPANEWPCFHGPRRDNTSTETGLLKAWPPDGPKRLWTASGIGRGYSSVTVAGGLIYTAGMIGKETYVFALDLDGKQRWHSLNGQSWEATMSHAVAYAGARATPTYDDGRVYHLSDGGRLAALDAKTGDAVWDLDLLKQFDAPVPKYGFAESVLIDGDRLLCCPGGTRGYMVCLDKKTGKLLWATTGIEGTVGYASLVIAELAGRRQILGMSSKVVFGVDAATGKFLWSVEHGNKRDNSATDPIPHDGHVFASTGYGKGSALVRLEPVPDGVKAEAVWAAKAMDNHHGGLVRVDRHVYGSGHESSGWFCLDFLTGKQAWNAKGKGSLTYADGMLYCLDEQGSMALVEPTPDRHHVVSSFPLPEGGTGLHWAHPVVCGGWLYVRHADRLFAYDVRAASTAPPAPAATPSPSAAGAAPKMDEALARDWLARWEKNLVAGSRNRYCDREMGEELGWLISPFLNGFYYGYLATSDVAWCDRLVDWADALVKRAVKEPDGFIGWPKLGATSTAFGKDLYTDSQLGEAMALRPMVLMAGEILRTPALEAKYGPKAREYLALSERIFRKWDAWGAWREVKDGGLWVVPPVGIDRETGKWAPGYDERRADGFSLPANKQNLIAGWLIAMYDVTKKPVYKERAEQWWRVMKSRIKPRDEKYDVWNYWDAGGPWDAKPDGSLKHWVGVHPNGGYYAIDVEGIVTAFEHGLVFTREDIARLIATNRDFMWNQQVRDAKFQRIDGGKPDDRWPKSPGVLWMALTPYDETLRKVFEANHDPAGWGGLSATPWYLARFAPGPSAAKRPAE